MNFSNCGSKMKVGSIAATLLYSDSLRFAYLGHSMRTCISFSTHSLAHSSQFRADGGGTGL